MIITLPALESTITHTSRNKIFHFIEQSISFEGDVLERNSHFVVLSNEDTSCCFTDNENFAKRDAAYIVLCSRVLTQDMLERDNLHFKRWIRHPKKRQSYNNVEIINSWKDAFHFKEEDLESGINGLRTPQIGAIHAILGHLKLKEEIANVILPTGTGKTETMLSVLISERCTKLLVLVPSVPLRKQIADKFKTLGYLKRFGIVDAIAINPIVGVLTTKFDTVEQLEQFFTDCNVIVSTMKIVADSPPDQVRKMAEICSHLFIDEAHHSKAKTWNKFISSFEREKVIQFTATPYRNDGERLNGKIVFNFSLRKAQEQGYFREIEFLPIREYDSDQADQLIADTAVRKLRSDREAGHNHLLMARCNDKERARSVFRLYENHEDLNPVIIYSGLPGKDAIVERIKNLEHKIIVCVDMLGEGFDLPQLKIAAFHDIRKAFQ